MSFLKNLNHLASVLVDVLKNLGRGKAWLALFVYASVLGLVLIAHYKHLTPLFYGPIKTVSSLINPDLSERLYHYPSHFLYLPWFYGWAKLAISVLIEGIFLGTAALAFWHGFQSTRPKGSLFKSALRLWPQFIMISIIFNGLITAASFFLPEMLHSMLISSPRRQLAFEFVFLPVIYSVLLALFFTAIPSVAIHGDSFWKAIKRSFSLAIRRPISMFILSLLVLIVPLLLSAAANRPEILIEKFRPELVFWVLFIGLFAEMVANYVWICASVRFLVDDEQ
ncbi:MAG: hypothetical protein IPH75_15390 [bacterium]|nr:hypothetical protein [bacterium]